MSDSLIEAVKRARVWPEGSGARQTLTKAAWVLVAKREQEIKDAEDLLARQWQWLEEKGGPGLEDVEENSVRYEDGMKRYLATLADYEDLFDKLNRAREELDVLGMAA